MKKSSNLKKLEKLDDETPTLEQFTNLSREVDENLIKFDKFKYEIEMKVKTFETIQNEINLDHRSLINENTKNIAKLQHEDKLNKITISNNSENIKRIF